MLSIHIFSTGSEITSGRSVDTNSTWIANELTGIGFTISKFIVLPDKPLLIEEEIQNIMKRDGENLIIMTGGLGATEDDYTLEVICKIANSKTIIHQKAEDKLKSIAAKRGKDFESILPVSKRQTTYPEKSVLIENDEGLAVGFYISLTEKTRLAAMPGVPREMKKMFENYLLPLIKKDYEQENLKSTSRYIWSISEAIFQEKFIKSHQELIQDKIEWGVTAKPGFIKVSFSSEDQISLELITKKLEVFYEDFIGNDIYSEIHNILTSTNQTLSTAESCTGGLCGKIITDMSGSSAYYHGSIVSYHNSIKENILNVKKETLEKFGAVSEETAIEMVEGVQKLLNTNYSISITGIAGPLGDTKTKNVGLLFISIKGNKDAAITYKYEIPLSREIFREYAANIALFHLYKKLISDTK